MEKDTLPSHSVTRKRPFDIIYNGHSQQSFLCYRLQRPRPDSPYLAATACGHSEPTDIATIGYPEMHIVMTVYYMFYDNDESLPWTMFIPATTGVGR